MCPDARVTPNSPTPWRRLVLGHCSWIMLTDLMPVAAPHTVSLELHIFPSSHYLPITLSIIICMSCAFPEYVLNLELLLLNMFSLICESLSYTSESVQCLLFSLEQWLFLFDLYGISPKICGLSINAMKDPWLRNSIQEGRGSPFVGFSTHQLTSAHWYH